MGFKFPWSKKKEAQEEYQPEVRQKEGQADWNVIRQETQQDQPEKRGVSALTEQEIFGIRSMLQVRGELAAVVFVQRLSGADLDEAQNFVKKLAAKERAAREEADAKLASFGEEGDSDEVLQQKALDSLTEDEIDELKQIIKERGAVVAIKNIRQKTGVGLYEARQYTDRLQNEMKYSR